MKLLGIASVLIGLFVAGCAGTPEEPEDPAPSKDVTGVENVDKEIQSGETVTPTYDKWQCAYDCHGGDWSASAFRFCNCACGIKCTKM